MDRKRLVGNGNNGLTKQESSIEMWYDSENSEVGETVISHWLKTLKLPNLPGILMPWMWTGSIPPQVKEQSTCGTESASSATRCYV